MKGGSLKKEVLTVLSVGKQLYSFAKSLIFNELQLTSHDLCGNSSGPGTDLWPCRTAYDWSTSERNHPVKEKVSTCFCRFVLDCFDMLER